MTATLTGREADAQLRARAGFGPPAAILASTFFERAEAAQRWNVRRLMQRTVALLVLLVLVTACSQNRLTGCLHPADIARRADTVAKLDWSATTEKAFVAALPGWFDSGSHNAGYGCLPCEGTAEYVELGRVISGTHLCSTLVLFTEEPGADTCRSSLNLFVVHSTVPTLAEAWTLAERLLQPFAPRRAEHLNHDAPLAADADFQWPDTPAQGITTYASVRLSRSEAGITVWVRIGRHGT